VENRSNDVAYEGQCAFGLSTGKTGVEGKSDNSFTDETGTYHFSNPVAKFLWKVLPNRKAKADEAWAAR
jgi:hypothetical protein